MGPPAASASRSSRRSRCSPPASASAASIASIRAASASTAAGGTASSSCAWSSESESGDGLRHLGEASAHARQPVAAASTRLALVHFVRAMIRRRPFGACGVGQLRGPPARPDSSARDAPWSARPRADRRAAAGGAVSFDAAHPRARGLRARLGGDPRERLGGLEISKRAAELRGKLVAPRVEGGERGSKLADVRQSTGRLPVEIRFRELGGVQERSKLVRIAARAGPKSSLEAAVSRPRSFQQPQLATILLGARAFVLGELDRSIDALLERVELAAQRAGRFGARFTTASRSSETAWPQPGAPPRRQRRPSAIAPVSGRVPCVSGSLAAGRPARERRLRLRVLRLLPFCPRNRAGRSPAPWRARRS